MKTLFLITIIWMNGAQSVDIAGSYAECVDWARQIEERARHGIIKRIKCEPYLVHWQEWVPADQ